MDDKDKLLAECKKFLRSVLLPEKDGVPVHRVKRSYEELVMSPFPHRAFGFSTPDEFILKMLRDTARLTTNKLGESVFVAVLTDDVKHIASMVTKQRSKKTKPKKKSFHPIHGRRPMTTQRYPVSSYRPPPSHFSHPAQSFAMASGIKRAPIVAPSSNPVRTRVITPSSNPVHARATVDSSSNPVRAGAQWQVPLSNGSVPPRTLPPRLAKQKENEVSAASRPTSVLFSKSSPWSGSSCNDVHSSGDSSPSTSEPSRHQTKPTESRVPDLMALSVDIPERIRVGVHRDDHGVHLAGHGRGRGINPTASHHYKSPAAGHVRPVGALNPPVFSRVDAVPKPAAAEKSTLYRVPTPPPQISMDHIDRITSATTEDLRHKLEKFRLPADNAKPAASVPSSQAAASNNPACPVDFVQLMEIKRWFMEKVRGKTTGLWSSALETMFTEEQGGTLPLSVKELGALCPDAFRLESCGKRFIVFPQDDAYFANDNFDGMRNFMPAGAAAAPAAAAAAVLHAPTSPRQTAPVLSSEPPKLKIPSEGKFVVYVSHVCSPAEIGIRIVGAEYNVKFEKLEESLPDLIRGRPIDNPQVELVCLAIMEMEFDDGSFEKTCNRVRVDKVTDGEADVWMLDHYGCEKVAVDKLFHLPAEYNQLPYQAFKCSMTGLEDCCDIDDKVAFNALATHVLGKTCNATVDKAGEIPCLTLVDIDTDVNYNKSLAQIIFTPRIPEVGATARCGVTYVCSEDGTTYLQIAGPGITRLETLAKQHLTKTVFTNDSSVAPTDVRPNEYYAVLSSSSGEWSRVVVLKFVAETRALVQFVDYGDCEEVDVAAIRCLPHPDLVALPAQAVACKLAGLPPEGTRWSRVGADLLVEWAENGNTLVRVVGQTPLTVQLLLAGDGMSLNKKLQVDAGDNTWIRPRIPEKYASILNGDEVYVTWAEDPSNFRIIPWRFCSDLQQLAKDMRSHYENSADNLSFSDIAVGELYAICYEDNVWYRARVTNKLLQVSLMVKFVDFGDYAAVDVKSVRPLANKFRTLPILALNAKIEGVLPPNGQWNEQEKTSFGSLVLDKKFTVYFTPSAGDAIRISQPVAGNHYYPVTLVQIQENNRPVFVNSLLTSMGIVARD